MCGHIKTDDGELVEIPSKRIDAMMEAVEEMTGKVIIWSRFRYDIRKIESEIARVHGPGSVVTYFGDTSDARQEAIQVSERQLTVRFFGGQPTDSGPWSNADRSIERDLLRQ